MSASLNCRAGDLARVISPGIQLRCPFCGDPATIIDADTLVVCETLDGTDWRIAEPIPFDITFVHGDIGIRAHGTCSAIDDAKLRPIRDPGEDAVDEILQRVGAHPGVLGMPVDEVTP